MNKKETIIISVSFLLLVLSLIPAYNSGNQIPILLMVGLLLIFSIYLLFNAVKRIYRQQEQDKFEINKSISILSEKVDSNARYNFKQLESMLNIQRLLPNLINIPHTRGWAASPDVLQVIMQEFGKRKPMYIIECGSGVSTLIFAALLKKNKVEGKVISLDHESHYAEKTREKIRENGLEDYALILDAPLKPYVLNDQEYKWYDLIELEKLGDIRFDMAFIDGPPTFTNKLARYPFFPKIQALLNPSYTLIVDDSDREDEQTMVKEWIKMDTDINVEDAFCEKGALVLRKN